MPTALLSDRSLVHVAGEDAEGFLQNLLTCDVETLPPGEARLGALLTPQGKILFDFLVSRGSDGFHLDVAAELAADLVKRLSFYKLRAKVTVRPATEGEAPLAVHAGWGTDAALPAGIVAFRDGRADGLGTRAYLSGLAGARGETDAYHVHRITLGVPEGGKDFAFGEAFPHEADMDQLGGVDFRKGCYVGQEVVSRMQHRGTARTRIVKAIFDDAAAAPETEIMAGDRRIGTIGSGAGHVALATLRLDRLAEALAAGEAIEAGGVPVSIEKPAWARFDFPEQDGNAKVATSAG